MLANIGLHSVGWVYKYHEWTTEQLHMPFLHACLVYFQYHELEENWSLSLVKRHSYLVKFVVYVPPERKDKIIQHCVFYFTWLMSLFPSCLGSEVASMLKLAFAAHFKTLRSSRCIFKDRGPNIQEAFVMGLKVNTIKVDACDYTHVITKLKTASKRCISFL